MIQLIIIAFYNVVGMIAPSKIQCATRKTGTWGGCFLIYLDYHQYINQTSIMVTPASNYTAFLTLIGDINNAFCHLEDEDVADICDGDLKLLDKAVKRFKSTVWENQL